jgi:flagellar FliJ protein
MKRFRFPLRPVGVLRAHRELRAREQFAAAVHAYVLAEEELGRTRERMRTLEQMLFHGRSATYRAAEAALLLADYSHQCHAEVETERGVIRARDEMQKKRSEYIEAHRQLEIVHRLEDKTRIAYRKDCEREEQAEFDDRAGRRPLAQTTPQS